MTKEELERAQAEMRERTKQRSHETTSPWASEGRKRIDTCEHEVAGKSVRPKINMDVRGRFGQLFAAAVNKKEVSLRQVAAKFNYSYEQMRKLVQGRSHPSEELLRGLCHYLSLDFDEALKGRERRPH